MLPPPPAAGAYTLTADDGAGHREAITLLIPSSPAEAAEAASAARNRWGMGAVGLAVIAGGTRLLRRVMRTPANPGRPVGDVVTRKAET